MFGKQQQQFQGLENTIKGLQVEIEYITKDINEIQKTKAEIKRIIDNPTKATTYIQGYFHRR